ncbi:MAG: hypothetical protein JXQ71_00030 [Verrucomicrobia bacterium]|nr:hypothetical protein [Verrucomicrobiota bacterium]
MKKLVTVAIALLLPILFAPASVQAQSTSCDAQLATLIEATKRLAPCQQPGISGDKRINNKLLKHLYDAQAYLMEGSIKSQWHAAKEVWKFDTELRKLYFKCILCCDDAAMLDESALQVLVCIVDLYYPDSGYDPYVNGVIACPCEFCP